MEKDILKQIYQKYRKEIYLYLYSLCKNSSLAEDLLQETFLKALLSLPDDHTNMRAWLYLVARNLFFNYYSKWPKKASRNIKPSRFIRTAQKKTFLRRKIKF